MGGYLVFCAFECSLFMLTKVKRRTERKTGYFCNWSEVKRTEVKSVAIGVSPSEIGRVVCDDDSRLTANLNNRFVRHVHAMSEKYSTRKAETSRRESCSGQLRKR
jgi:hypothetical protein